MKAIHMIAFTILVIGGLNWGLVIFGWDVATWGLGDGVNKVIYALVALSAIYEAVTHVGRCKECKNQMPSGSGM